MNFRPELAAAVMAGTKTVTRRLVSANARSPWSAAKCGYRVGQRVAICPGRGKHNIGYAIVTSVELMALGWLTIEEARREGFHGPAAFEAAWTDINAAYDEDAVVWRIGLRADS